MTDAIYRMPTAFGPALGPRQGLPGVVYDAASSPRKFCVYAVWRSEGAALQALLPAGFSLRGEPEIALEFSYMTEIAWLAGRGYNMLTVRIPVRYEADGQTVDGYFQPVVWENMAEPILSGREELGWSKIYAELPEPGQVQGGCQCQAEWMGFRFLELRLSELGEGDGKTLEAAPVLHHKYIPATGAWGQADVDCITMTPAGGSKARLLASALAGRCELTLHRPRWEDMPTQHAIVHGLADLPWLECRRAGTYSTIGGKDLSDQVRL